MKKDSDFAVVEACLFALMALVFYTLAAALWTFWPLIPALACTLVAIEILDRS